MGILGLLLEICGLLNLKMNLKCDIEVCLIEDSWRRYERRQAYLTSQSQIVPEVNPLINVEPQLDVVIPSHPWGLLTEDQAMPALSLPEWLPSRQGAPVTSLSPFSVIVKPKISALGLQLQFQRICSYRNSNNERTSSKGICYESDKTRINNAALLMVASLAGAWKFSTCHLQGASPSVQISTNDNLGLGCAVVEKSAIGKALQTIDVYEDFVSIPLQNQPIQSSNALPAVQSSLLVVLVVPPSNPTLYPTTQGDPGFGSNMDTALTQTQSTSSAHIGESGVVKQHGSDIDSVVPSFPSTVVCINRTNFS
ncbi:hypothetical protein MKW92_021250 [Papaver armeniacum]|nr:hypothetical protein MKW92_021250 [Papaver armeniacum]